MDKDARRAQLESDLRLITQYKDHPITKRVLADSDHAQERLLDQVILSPIVNIETFFAHFEAIGHLRGIRALKSTITEAENEVT